MIQRPTLPKHTGLRSVSMLTVVASVMFLAGCQTNTTGFGRADDSPYAPGTYGTLDDSVDGLIVGHRLTAAGEHELALKAYKRAAIEHGFTVDVLSA